MFTVKFHIESEPIEKWPKGRRTPKKQPEIKKVFRIAIASCEYNESKKAQFLQNESCFVIISNKMISEVSDRELLSIYKEQHVVEGSFRLMKKPCLASPYFLKKPKRVDALSIVLTISLLIRALLQYRIREGLKKHNEENTGVVIKAAWNNKPLKSPTFQLLHDFSSPFYFEKEDDQTYIFSFERSTLGWNIKILLELMNINLTELLE